MAHLRLIGAAVALATASAIGPNASTHGHSEGSMHQLQTIESIVSPLAASGVEVGTIVRALGRTISDQDGEFVVHIGKMPFESAKVSTFHERIYLEFTLSAGSWRLRDITGDPQAWQATVRMPDTGRIQIYRTWKYANMAITCTVIVEGNGPLQDEVIQGLDCLITRR